MPSRGCYLRLVLAVLTVAWAWGDGVLTFCAADSPVLRYVAIITRHGVRSPTWTAERLNQYSAEPWPAWNVPPGYLTPHGRLLMQLVGNYYREWLAGEHLLGPAGCQDAARIYIHADTDQRTLETGRALAETLLPGCAVPTHSAPEGSRDPLFSSSAAGAATPDWEVAAQAVRARLGTHPDLHVAAFETLESVLAGAGVPPKPLKLPPAVTVSATAKGVQLDESWSVASTLSEDLLLEYAEGMPGKAVGWGRLDRATLGRVLELHAAYADLTRRTPYLARARGSNILEHVLRSLEQAATQKPVAGALGPPETAVLVLVGHDTNLSNLSGLLGLSWHLPGYPADEPLPGGALVFALWQQTDTGQFSVRAQYVAQTLEQMRSATPLTLASPPAREDLAVAGCGPAAAAGGCPWEAFRKLAGAALAGRFAWH
jgi:4-phytase/acid phosphatase